MSIVLPGTLQKVARQFQQQGRFARTWLTQDEKFAPGMVVHLSDTGPTWEWVCGLVRLLEDQAPWIGERIGLLLQPECNEGRSMQ